MARRVIRRDWWFPFVVGVWEDVGDIRDWRRGQGRLWLRRGVFLRRKTAERYAQALEEEKP